MEASSDYEIFVIRIPLLIISICCVWICFINLYWNIGYDITNQISILAIYLFFFHSCELSIRFNGFVLIIIMINWLFIYSNFLSFFVIIKDMDWFEFYLQKWNIDFSFDACVLNQIELKRPVLRIN